MYKALDCKQPICPTCLLDRHRQHNVVEIEDIRKKEELLKKLESLKAKLVENRTFKTSRKEEIKDKTLTCVEKIKKKRDEIYQQFENLREKVEQRGKEAELGLGKEIAAISENISKIESMKSILGESTTSRQDINHYTEVVCRMDENNKHGRIYVHPRLQGIRRNL